MPANYAMHRFGAEAMRTLPEKQQRLMQRCRRLYNAGVHGSDLFFYYRPMVETAVGGLYRSCHAMTGRGFFTRGCEALKNDPSEGGTACLYGLLANYCLNRKLSELFREQTLPRTELEVELDRYLLSLDGKLPPKTQDISASLKLTRGECVTVALFFPPATAGNVLTAHREMVFWVRGLSAKSRWFATALLHLTGEDFRRQRMPDHANHRCIHLDKPMLACYERALESYPRMAAELKEFLEQGTPLGEDFDRPFHGKGSSD